MELEVLEIESLLEFLQAKKRKNSDVLHFFLSNLKQFKVGNVNEGSAHKIYNALKDIEAEFKNEFQNHRKNKFLHSIVSKIPFVGKKFKEGIDEKEKLLNQNMSEIEKIKEEVRDFVIRNLSVKNLTSFDIASSIYRDKNKFDFIMQKIYFDKSASDKDKIDILSNLINQLKTTQNDNDYAKQIAEIKLKQLQKTLRAKEIEYVVEEKSQENKPENTQVKKELLLELKKIRDEYQNAVKSNDIIKATELKLSLQEIKEKSLGDRDINNIADTLTKQIEKFMEKATEISRAPTDGGIEPVMIKTKRPVPILN